MCIYIYIYVQTIDVNVRHLDGMFWAFNNSPEILKRYIESLNIQRNKRIATWL